MERQTFWQALFYLGSFYLTWPILLAVNLSHDAQLIYPFMQVIVILAPLQGFLNFLVYARPRILKRLEERRKTRRQAANDPAATSKNAMAHRQLQLALMDTAATSKNTVSGACGVSSMEDGSDTNSTEMIKEMIEMIEEESHEDSVVGKDIGNEAAARIEESSTDASDFI
jgi:hypothetical protein